RYGAICACATASRTGLPWPCGCNKPRLLAYPNEHVMCSGAAYRRVVLISRSKLRQNMVIGGGVSRGKSYERVALVWVVAGVRCRPAWHSLGHVSPGLEACQ